MWCHVASAAGPCEQLLAQVICRQLCTSLARHMQTALCDCILLPMHDFFLTPFLQPVFSSTRSHGAYEQLISVKFISYRGLAAHYTPP